VSPYPPLDHREEKLEVSSSVLLYRERAAGKAAYRLVYIYVIWQWSRTIYEGKWTRGAWKHQWPADFPTGAF